MQIIPIISTKGGTGKTTGAVNLSAALAEQGMRVCVVDLDPQCSATVTLGHRKDLPRTVGHLFRDDPAAAGDLVMHTPYGVDLIPSTPGLMAAEDWIHDALFGEARLHQALVESDIMAMYDYIIIDTPGFAGRLYMSSLVAADSVIITMKPSALSTDVLATLVKSVQTVGRQRGRALSIQATYFNEVRPNTNIARVNIAEAAEVEHAGVVETYISLAKDIEEAVYARKPVLAHKPSSTAAREYRQLATVIFDSGVKYEKQLG